MSFVLKIFSDRVFMLRKYLERFKTGFERVSNFYCRAVKVIVTTVLITGTWIICNHIMALINCINVINELRKAMKD